MIENIAKYTPFLKKKKGADRKYMLQCAHPDGATRTERVQTQGAGQKHKIRLKNLA